MRVKKIKLKGCTVEIEVETREGEKSFKVTKLESFDEPLDSFPKALQALTPYILEICELPEEYADGLEVLSVTFSYGGAEDVMGASITALKTLSTAKAPFVINTPHLASGPYNENGVGPFLSDMCTFQLEILIEEAMRYWAGERKETQLSLLELGEPAEV